MPAIVQRVRDIAAEKSRRPAGNDRLRATNRRRRSVARASRVRWPGRAPGGLAPEIGVDPQAPFGLEQSGAVAEFLADLVGSAYRPLRPPRSAGRARRPTPEPSFSQKIQLPAHAVWRRQRFGKLETRREMRDRLRDRPSGSRPGRRRACDNRRREPASRPRRNDRPAIPARSRRCRRNRCSSAWAMRSCHSRRRVSSRLS